MRVPPVAQAAPIRSVAATPMPHNGGDELAALRLEPIVLARKVPAPVATAPAASSKADRLAAALDAAQAIRARERMRARAA